MNKDKIAIIGLGYVGLPLARLFATKYSVVGFDINIDRISELTSGVDTTLEVNKETLQSVLIDGDSDETGLFCTNQLDKIKDCNYYIITVPTPVDKNNRPILTPLIKASETVGKVLKNGDTVIYESTVYPGATEEDCVPVLEKVSGLKFNKDFYAGYSPERINPGDKEHTVEKILKVTSGSTPDVGERVNDLYKSVIIAGTHLAPTIKVAEASKVIENSQRDINIAFVNELAKIFNLMDINTHDVLEAAGTKWNFLPFKPGLVGGHCIGVDPYYLTYKAEKMGYKPNLILSSRQINNGMSAFIAKKTIKFLVDKNKNIKDSNILIMGLTFKENCPDIRNTKVVDIIEELNDFGCKVDVYDPWVDKEEEKKTYKSGIINDPFKSDKKYSAIIVAVAHDQFKSITNDSYQQISDGEFILIDIKGIVEKPTWKL